MAKRTVKKHEDDYIHIPKSFLLVLVGIVKFPFVFILVTIIYPFVFINDYIAWYNPKYKNDLKKHADSFYEYLFGVVDDDLIYVKKAKK